MGKANKANKKELSNARKRDPEIWEENIVVQKNYNLKSK